MSGEKERLHAAVLVAPASERRKGRKVRRCCGHRNGCGYRGVRTPRPRWPGRIRSWPKAIWVRVGCSSARTCTWVAVSSMTRRLNHLSLRRDAGLTNPSSSREAATTQNGSSGQGNDDGRSNGSNKNNGNEGRSRNRHGGQDNNSGHHQPWRRRNHYPRQHRRHRLPRPINHRSSHPTPRQPKRPPGGSPGGRRPHSLG